MNRTLFIAALALGLLLLACAGWTAQGVRWALTGTRRRRASFATA